MLARLDYKFALDQCDLTDKVKGEEFRQKRMKWLFWLAGDDHHSIIKQIYSLLWDYALFCTVSELRRLAVEKPQSGIGFNGPIARLFDAGFVTTQATAIRRLTEWPSTRKNRAVISIRTLLQDIRVNLRLITRENYVCHDGLPYDFESVRDAAFSNLPKDERGVSVGVMPMSGPAGWPMAERMHKAFDKLAQVGQMNRSRTDLISDKIFDHLESHLEECDKVKKFVDKFIAHAADPDNRTGLATEERGLTLERLEACHKRIYRVVSFIYGILLWEANVGGVPVPQFDHLKGLDQRWADKNRLEEVSATWAAISKKVAAWDSETLWPPGYASS